MAKAFERVNILLLESCTPVSGTIAIGEIDIPLVPLEPDEPDVPEVEPVTTTVTLPEPLFINVTPLNVNPLTFATDVVPSLTVNGDAPPPDVNPVTWIELPSLLFSVKVSNPLSYVPPVTTPVNPVIDTVPPVLLYKSSVVIPE